MSTHKFYVGNQKMIWLGKSWLECYGLPLIYYEVVKESAILSTGVNSVSGECPHFSGLAVEAPQCDCLFYATSRKINLDLMVGLITIIICSISILCDYYFFIYISFPLIEDLIVSQSILKILLYWVMHY